LKKRKANHSLETYGINFEEDESDDKEEENGIYKLNNFYL